MSALRSVRNNNPGNIDRSRITWQGVMPPDKMTPEQKIEPRFVVFESAAWGFRAMAVILHTYFTHDGCKTINAIVSRWAPPEENDTAAYIKDVSEKMGVADYALLDLTQPAVLCNLARAIASHEAAGPLPYDKSFYPYWHDADLAAGVYAALGNAPLPAVS